MIDRGSKEGLDEHLSQEHHISPFSSYLREIVYGGNDGIVTTFAVVAGFAGADSMSLTLPAISVLIFGFANLFSDATSMALGNFLSIRADQDVYRRHKFRELSEIRHHPNMEVAETVVILQQKGFTKKQSEDLAQIYKQNEAYWTEFMMRDELDMTNPEKENPYYTSLATFFSFVSFGFVPIVPYVLFGNQSNSFAFSIGSTIGALLLLGLLRYKVTTINLLRSVGEVLILGGTSAIIAYCIGTLFRI